LAVSPAAAAEGVVIAQQITSGTTVTRTEVQIERTRMRTVVTTGTETQVVIFDGAKQTMYVINPARKSYLEITKAELDRMAGMMQGMMAQMANLPPAARAQMEGMMRGRGMAAPAAAERTLYKRVGADRVGRWTCDKYEGYRADQKVTERCTATPAALGLTAADFAVTQQLAEFVRTALPQAADQVATLGQTEADGFTGFPLRTVSVSGDRTTVTEVTAASRTTFDDAIFAIPADFTRQSMMGGR
jgi:hypothetical protein